MLRAKVSVFVDLYMKNRQLSEQAALLRSRLPETLLATGPATAEPMLTELSARLRAVEEVVTVLSGQTAATSGSASTESVRQLEHRVGRLRDMVEALRAGG